MLQPWTGGRSRQRWYPRRGAVGIPNRSVAAQSAKGSGAAGGFVDAPAITFDSVTDLVGAGTLDQAPTIGDTSATSDFAGTGSLLTGPQVTVDATGDFAGVGVLFVAVPGDQASTTDFAGAGTGLLAGAGALDSTGDFQGVGILPTQVFIDSPPVAFVAAGDHSGSGTVVLTTSGDFVGGSDWPVPHTELVAGMGYRLESV